MDIVVRVRPNASMTRITKKMSDGTIKIDVAAVAEDGKANGELIRFLAREFNVARDQVEIVAGHASRKKTVRITE